MRFYVVTILPVTSSINFYHMSFIVFGIKVHIINWNRKSLTNQEAERSNTPLTSLFIVHVFHYVHGNSLKKKGLTHQMQNVHQT